MGVVIIGVTVAPKFCPLAEVGMGVVDVEVALHCVAAVEHADNKAQSTSTIFLFPKPSVNEDVTLRPTAEAALTAIRSRLSESDRNIPGLIARWTAWIFSDNKSNPVVNERCVIANRGVVVTHDVEKIAERTVFVAKLGAIAERGVVVSERGVIAVRHGVVSERGVVAMRNGIGVIGNRRGIVAKLGINERDPSGARVSLGSMESSASGMASSPKGGIVVIVSLPSTTV